MLHKSFKVLETKTDGEHGEFTALVSTFGNVDHVGDRIVRGAYAKTLQDWRKSGDPLPIILAHQWDDVMAHVGYANAADIQETAKGLVVKGTLDVDDNPVAKQVHKLMKRRTLKEFSIGYTVPPGGEHRAKDGANEITEIELSECGPCLKGIDPKTELQAVKSALATQDLPGAEEQRTAARTTAREVEETRVPDMPPRSAEQEADLVEELEKSEAQLADTRRLLAEATKGPTKDPKALREEASRAAREVEQQNFPIVPEQPPVVAPEIDVVKELQDVKAELSTITATLAELNAKDDAELRQEAARTAREVEEQKIPDDVPPAPAAPVEPEVDELQEVKARLAASEKALEDLQAKANGTDKEPDRVRSVDSLRKQANDVALEIASGGESLRKPPPKAAPKRHEPTMEMAELKRRMRDEMLGVLSGKTIE